VGKLDRTLDGPLALMVRGASEMPEELRGRWEPFLLDSLREVAALLAVARYARLNAFTFARGT